MIYINYTRYALGLCAFIATAFTPLAYAQDGLADDKDGLAYEKNEPTAFDLRHEACLDRITDEPEQAYEAALTWQDEGGGWRAQHCIAMSLFGLGRTNMAAHRMEQIARTSLGVTDAQKADYYFEATNFWLIYEDYKRALSVSSAGLELRAEHLDLLTARARAHAGLGDYNAAQEDLNRVLKLAPTRAAAYRYSADLHRKSGDLDAALRDIEKSLALDGTQIETAILRGDIREDIRKAERAEIDANLDFDVPVRPETDSGADASDGLVIPPFIQERPSK